MKKLTWYHKLGFSSNPFSIKPAAFHNELLGYEAKVEDIIDQISDSNIIFIFGKYGTGKTSVLKRVIDEFRARKRGFFTGKKVIYYSCNQSDESIDFDKLLVGAGGFLSRLFAIRKKNMIILIDEAQNLNKKDVRGVKEYHEKGFFKSVVFVSSEEGSLKLSNELKKLIGKNKYLFGNLNQEEAVDLVRGRIGDLHFISDDIIVMILRRNRNPRAFLKNCEDVCRHAFEQDADVVTGEHVRYALKA